MCCVCYTPDTIQSPHQPEELGMDTDTLRCSNELQSVSDRTETDIRADGCGAHAPRHSTSKSGECQGAQVQVCRGLESNSEDMFYHQQVL